MLESGEVLPKGATLAYRVHGPAPGAAPKGVILHPTSFDAVHDELAYQIGDGRALDTSQYTVIVPNLMGNGVSFSPSLEERPGGGAPPPLLTVSDNVRAQRLMLRALGVGCDAESPLELVYGYSMGGLQAYEWAVAYPEAVRRVAVVCGASRCSEINAVFLRSLEAALQADGAWDEEARRFVRHPSRGLHAFGAIYAGWGVGTEWYEGRRGESAGGAAMGGNRSTPNAAAGYASADDFVDRSYLPAFAQCDGDDLLSQIRTWRHADVRATWPSAGLVEGWRRGRRPAQRRGRRGGAASRARARASDAVRHRQVFHRRGGAARGGCSRRARHPRADPLRGGPPCRRSASAGARRRARVHPSACARVAAGAGLVTEWKKGLTRFGRDPGVSAGYVVQQYALLYGTGAGRVSGVHICSSDESVSASDGGGYLLCIRRETCGSAQTAGRQRNEAR